MKYCLFLDQTGTPRIAPIMAVNNNLNFDGMDCYSSATETIDPGTILNSAMHSDSQPQYLSNGESSINGLEENHDGTNVNAEPLQAPAPHNQIIPILGQLTGEPTLKSDASIWPIQPNDRCSSVSLTAATYTGDLDVSNTSRIAANESSLTCTMESTILHLNRSNRSKNGSLKREHMVSSTLHAVTLSSMERGIHVDVVEDTVILVESESPKAFKIISDEKLKQVGAIAQCVNGKGIKRYAAIERHSRHSA